MSESHRVREHWRRSPKGTHSRVRTHHRANPRRESTGRREPHRRRRAPETWEEIEADDLGITVRELRRRKAQSRRDRGLPPEPRRPRGVRTSQLGPAPDDGPAPSDNAISYLRRRGYYV